MSDDRPFETELCHWHGRRLHGERCEEHADERERRPGSEVRQHGEAREPTEKRKGHRARPSESLARQRVASRVIERNQVGVPESAPPIARIPRAEGILLETEHQLASEGKVSARDES